jgi:uncharacterized protein (TIGR02466 family)
MKKQLDSLFATPVQLIDIENDFLCDRYANFLENLIGETLAEKSFSSLTTKDNLHMYEEFDSLVDLVKFQMTEYARDIIGLQEDSLELSAMWSNVRNSGSKHHAHQHPNSYLSGVLYLKVPQEEEIGNIFFVDPRQAKNMMYGNYTKVTSMSERTWWYKPKKGVMLLFPSWLEHGTEEYISNNTEKRISVSFNFILTRCDENTMSFDIKNLMKDFKHAE